MARARLVVQGRVQGVNFRYHTRVKALALGLTGTVRNCSDGSVEAVFQGDRRAVEKAIAWCRRGPRSARVRDLQVAWEEPEQPLAGFEILR
ncbi:MAG: acylphosphatase [bacterium]|jgi:acylphosphatase|nr:acylphosphatase [bacterium]